MLNQERLRALVSESCMEIKSNQEWTRMISYNTYILQSKVKCNVTLVPLSFGRKEGKHDMQYFRKAGFPAVPFGAM